MGGEQPYDNNKKKYKVKPVNTQILLVSVFKNLTFPPQSEYRRLRRRRQHQSHLKQAFVLLPVLSHVASFPSASQ